MTVCFSLYLEKTRQVTFIFNSTFHTLRQFKVLYNIMIKKRKKENLLSSKVHQQFSEVLCISEGKIELKETVQEKFP